MSEAGGVFLAIFAWLGMCVGISGLLYLAFLVLKFRNEPLRNDADGDWPRIPDDLKSSFHAHSNTETGA